MNTNISPDYSIDFDGDQITECFVGHLEASEQPPSIKRCRSMKTAWKLQLEFRDSKLHGREYVSLRDTATHSVLESTLAGFRQHYNQTQCDESTINKPLLTYDFTLKTNKQLKHESEEDLFHNSKRNLLRLLSKHSSRKYIRLYLRPILVSLKIYNTRKSHIEILQEGLPPLILHMADDKPYQLLKIGYRLKILPTTTDKHGNELKSYFGHCRAGNNIAHEDDNQSPDVSFSTKGRSYYPYSESEDSSRSLCTLNSEYSFSVGENRLPVFEIIEIFKRGTEAPFQYLLTKVGLSVVHAYYHNRPNLYNRKTLDYEYSQLHRRRNNDCDDNLKKGFWRHTFEYEVFGLHTPSVVSCGKRISILEGRRKEDECSSSSKTEEERKREYTIRYRSGNLLFRHAAKDYSTYLTMDLQSIDGAFHEEKTYSLQTLNISTPLLMFLRRLFVTRMSNETTERLRYYMYCNMHDTPSY
jgi:hypothetical protein